MKKLLLPAIAAAMLVGCGKQKPAIDIWTAAGTGNIAATKQHLAAGTDPNAKDPAGGGTPLMAAALLGQTEAASLLIGRGAKVNSKNNDGVTALHVAAFFCQPETAELLLEKGAETKARNNKGETPLDTVAALWSPQLEGVYVVLAGILHISLDLERIKRGRPEMAELLRKNGGLCN